MQTLGQWPVHRRYVGRKQLSLSLSRQSDVTSTSHMDSESWENYPRSNQKTQGWGKLFVTVLSPVIPS